jgi:SEC-C motif domain protein
MTSTQCPCQSLEQPTGQSPGKSYSACCEPLHAGKVHATTAEQLMRSRYSAFVKHKIDYLEDTYHPSKRQEFDRTSVTDWSKKSKWAGLKILKTVKGGPEDREGIVEFVAHFERDGKPEEHHEIAEFKKESSDRRWYFVDGFAPSQKPIVRSDPKVGRNDPCPCGSGKKAKKCCGN